MAFKFIEFPISKAVGCPTGGSIQVDGGLASGGSSGSGGKFKVTSGVCVFDPKAAFVPFKIPTYAEIKSIYYDQAKDNPATLEKKAPVGNGGSATQNDISSVSSTSTAGQIYLVDGDLNITSQITGNQIKIVFVNKNLKITPPPGSTSTFQLNYGTANTGLVFIVSGDVEIAPKVTQINAVIITAGNLYTAGKPCLTSNVTAPQLVINGSLISLHDSNNMKFCRKPANLAIPAEKINYQPKYLSILRNIFSETYQKWTEVSGTISLPTPTPTP